MDTKIMLPISKQHTKSIGKMLKMESTQLMNFINIYEHSQFDLLISVLFDGGFKQLLTFTCMYIVTCILLRENISHLDLQC